MFGHLAVTDSKANLFVLHFFDILFIFLFFFFLFINLFEDNIGNVRKLRKAFEDVPQNVAKRY